MTRFARYFPNEKLAMSQGEELRALLNDLGWTETDFAKHTQVCINTVNNWVKGHTRVPRLAFLYLNGLKRLHGKEPNAGIQSSERSEDLLE